AAGLAQSLDRGLDDRHALPEIGFWVQGGVDLGFRKELRDLRLRVEGLAKVDRFCPSGLRGLPHELVRLLATESLAGEGHHHGLRHDLSVRRLEVRPHAVREHAEGPEDLRCAREHLVDQDTGVRQQDPLGGAIRQGSLIAADWTSIALGPNAALVPTAPDILPTTIRGATSRRRSRCRATSEANTAILRPKVIGTAA